MGEGVIGGDKRYGDRRGQRKGKGKRNRIKRADRLNEGTKWE
jgi:hypothetical protein